MPQRRHLWDQGVAVFDQSFAMLHSFVRFDRLWVLILAFACNNVVLG